MRVNLRSAGGESFVDFLESRQFLPDNRKLGGIKHFDGFRFPYDGGHSFAAMTHLPAGEYGLVGEARNYSIAVFSGNVFGSENRGDSGMVANECFQVAEIETRPMIGTADHANGQSANGNFIGAKDLTAFDFAPSVEADEALPDCIPGLG